MNPNVVIGLKRLSWLFAIIVGVVTVVITGQDEGWGFPEDYLPLTIATTIGSFALFRMGIWVVKGFAGENSTRGKETALKSSTDELAAITDLKQEISRNHRMGTKWLYAWENIILPLNILTGIVCLITFRQPVWMIMMVVTLVTIIGLKKRALWGWYLNFGLLILATLNYPLYLHGKRCSEYELERRLVESGLYTYARGRDISPPTITLENYLLPLAVATVCFLLPNAIYFGKRKAMFKHIGTMNKDEIQSSASVYLDSEDLDYEDDSEDD